MERFYCFANGIRGFQLFILFWSDVAQVSLFIILVRAAANPLAKCHYNTAMMSHWHRGLISGQTVVHTQWKKPRSRQQMLPLVSSLGFSQRRAGRVTYLVSRSHHYPDCTAPWTTVGTYKWWYCSKCFRTDFHIALMQPIPALISHGAPAFTVGVPFKVRRTSPCLVFSCLVANVWICGSCATWLCQPGGAASETLSALQKNASLSWKAFTVQCDSCISRK